jgi:hypothetical protein
MRLITNLAAGLLVCVAPLAMAAGDPSGIASNGPELIGSAGSFAVLDDYDYPLLGGLQYRGAPRTRWALRPGVGWLAGEGGMTYLFADLAHDFALPHRWVATLSLGFGWFDEGDAIDVVDAREFQTVLAVSRELESGLRVGLAASHVSNASLSSPNKGTETLALFVALPVGRGRQASSDSVSASGAAPDAASWASSSRRISSPASAR